ncbi:MAG: hypothetical protein O2819_07545 [Planctomycetota bacterium]|nr:hypothetical protein [Planctomycetota bacterium]MDA1105282.1 hypothetical protein [Planctomycetota bacterium]
MRIAFLGLPVAEQRLYIEEVAARRGVSAVIIEKDFWVCWLLAVLFRSEFAGSLVFKGEGAETDLLFHYPSVLPSGFEYIRRSVKLEFGSRRTPRPKRHWR